MDAIARGQDELMGSMHMAQYSPKLNPEKPASYWLKQPGAPKAERAREKPMTIPYTDILQRWANTQTR
jgi:glycerol transport system substrate-binding protein